MFSPDVSSINCLNRLPLFARPTDQRTIDYLIQTANVLSGVGANGDDDDKMEKGELLDSIMCTLNMTEVELTAHTARSILSTARQIIAAKYPEPDAAYANVKKEHIKAVIGR